MLAMLPIKEPEVVESLNQGRYQGNIQGFVVMNGPSYLGYALYKLEDTVTTVLESDVSDPPLLDGLIRACIAAGDNRGVKNFAVNTRQKELKTWWEGTCKDKESPVSVEHIFSYCNHAEKPCDEQDDR